MGQTKNSVDARDEFPHISEQNKGSQLGKLHRDCGGGVEGRRAGGGYTDQGVISV